MPIEKEEEINPEIQDVSDPNPPASAENQKGVWGRTKDRFFKDKSRDFSTQGTTASKTQAFKSFFGVDDSANFKNAYDSQYKKDFNKQISSNPQNKLFGNLKTLPDILTRNAIHGHYQGDHFNFIKRNAELVNKALGVKHGYLPEEIQNHQDFAPLYTKSFNNLENDGYKRAMSGMTKVALNTTSNAYKAAIAEKNHKLADRIFTNIHGLVGLHHHFASNSNARERKDFDYDTETLRKLLSEYQGHDLYKHINSNFIGQHSHEKGYGYGSEIDDISDDVLPLNEYKKAHPDEFEEEAPKKYSLGKMVANKIKGAFDSSNGNPVNSGPKDAEKGKVLSDSELAAIDAESFGKQDKAISANKLDALNNERRGHNYYLDRQKLYKNSDQTFNQDHNVSSELVDVTEPSIFGKISNKLKNVPLIAPLKDADSGFSDRTILKGRGPDEAPQKVMYDEDVNRTNALEEREKLLERNESKILMPKDPIMKGLGHEWGDIQDSPEDINRQRRPGESKQLSAYSKGDRILRARTKDEIEHDKNAFDVEAFKKREEGEINSFLDGKDLSDRDKENQRDRSFNLEQSYPERIRQTLNKVRTQAHEDIATVEQEVITTKQKFEVMLKEETEKFEAKKNEQLQALTEEQAKLDAELMAKKNQHAANLSSLSEEQQKERGEKESQFASEIAEKQKLLDEEKAILEKKRQATLVELVNVGNTFGRDLESLTIKHETEAKRLTDAFEAAVAEKNNESKLMLEESNQKIKMAEEEVSKANALLREKAAESAARIKEISLMEEENLRNVNNKSQEEIGKRQLEAGRLKERAESYLAEARAESAEKYREAEKIYATHKEYQEKAQIEFEQLKENHQQEIEGIRSTLDSAVLEAKSKAQAKMDELYTKNAIASKETQSDNFTGSTEQLDIFRKMYRRIHDRHNELNFQKFNLEKRVEFVNDLPQAFQEYKIQEAFPKDEHNIPNKELYAESLSGMTDLLNRALQEEVKAPGMDTDMAKYNKSIKETLKEVENYSNNYALVYDNLQPDRDYLKLIKKVKNSLIDKFTALRTQQENDYEKKSFSEQHHAVEESVNPTVKDTEDQSMYFGDAQEHSDKGHFLLKKPLKQSDPTEMAVNNQRQKQDNEIQASTKIQDNEMQAVPEIKAGHMQTGHGGIGRKDYTEQTMPETAEQAAQEGSGFFSRKDNEIQASTKIQDNEMQAVPEIKAGHMQTGHGGIGRKDYTEQTMPETAEQAASTDAKEFTYVKGHSHTLESSKDFAFNEFIRNDENIDSYKKEQSKVADFNGAIERDFQGVAKKDFFSDSEYKRVGLDKDFFKKIMAQEEGILNVLTPKRVQDMAHLAKADLDSSSLKQDIAKKAFSMIVGKLTNTSESESEKIANDYLKSSSAEIVRGLNKIRAGASLQKISFRDLPNLLFAKKMAYTGKKINVPDEALQDGKVLGSPKYMAFYRLVGASVDPTFETTANT